MNTFKSILLVVVAAVLFTACSSSKEASKTPKKPSQYYALVSTSFGDMKLKLYNETPKHRDNFIKLANEGFYDSLLFHRVIDGFMIQGGDPASKTAKKGQNLGNGGPGYTLPAEIDSQYFHKKGALAAARLGDNVNPERKSSGSQFYIVQGRVPGEKMLRNVQTSYRFKYTEEQLQIYRTQGGTPHLDYMYTVFGELVEGWDVLETISKQKGNRMNRPNEDIRMTVKIVTE